MLTTPLFTQHSRSWRDNRYVYPVISRRSRGLSVGVNLNPDKVCNFDCIYCSVDRTVPAVVTEVDLDILRVELDHMLGLVSRNELWTSPPFDGTPIPLKRLNDVAFSGDGEPTSYPAYGQAARLAVELLAQHHLTAKVVTITNATLFHRPAVAETLAYLDAHNGEIWAKLDAGTEPYYKLVERTSIPLARVLGNLTDAARVRPIVIQSLFMNVQGIPPGAEEVDAYVGRLTDIRSAGGQIKHVQVYTVARAPAEAFVSHLSPATLDGITDKVRAAGFFADAFYGPS